MKRLLTCGFWLCLIFALAGCGTGAREIALKSQSERTDVFKEVQEGVPIPKEFVELTITSSIKTHLEGFYLLESEGSLHGKPGYPFVINIDGQAATWKADGQRENTPTHDENGKLSPEGGEGMRYNLQKRILLSAGSHKIFFGLPAEKVSLQFELTLREKETYFLELRPVYIARGKLSRHFLHGVETFEFVLRSNSRQTPDL